MPSSLIDGTDEEVTYQDFSRDHRKPRGELQGWGWTKILAGCQIALRNAIHWLWIDTCCINKDSSAELSEATNSIYSWYEKSRVCYVFLEDFELGAAFSEDEFKRSEWVTRGWTLQELLAPRNLDFFDCAFQYVGSRIQFQHLISSVTGIDSAYITQLRGTDHSSIAMRFNWAARRETSRDEDQAYCLLGMFSVNMPLLYGEGGTKAFVRLQMEILRRSEDESIFAWDGDTAFRVGLLCPSMSSAALEWQQHVWKTQTIHAGYIYRHTYTMTNKGLEFLLDIPDTENVRSSLQSKSLQGIVMPLNCVQTVRHNGSHELMFRRLGILFSAQTFEANNVMIAFREKLVFSRESLSRSSLEFGTETELGCLAIIGSEGPTKSWKVYFPQQGL